MGTGATHPPLAGIFVSQCDPSTSIFNTLSSRSDHLSDYHWWSDTAFTLTSGGPGGRVMETGPYCSNAVRIDFIYPTYGSR